MATANSEKYMQLAVDEAWKYQFLTYPNPAVGATVTKNGKVLSAQAHKKAGKPHAEVLALKERKEEQSHPSKHK
jgi:diaminohydroxyphosphoribosylaminopyrimidine deaminase/5-amino-6-(5-phosphoribosylamino)uracil reductase